MTIQKLITYTPLDINGKEISLNQNLELMLNVSEISGNYLLHKDLWKHFKSKQQYTSSTKTRSQVRGGGCKPWRQKGTGRARAGSNRSPLWKGGGIIFGPKPKLKNLKLNKKERLLALQTLIYNKRNNILVLESLENQTIKPKTKTFLEICQNCNINLDQKLLFVVHKKTNLLKSITQNLENVELISVLHLNTFSLMKAKQILFTQTAINYISHKLHKESYCD